MRSLGLPSEKNSSAVAQLQVAALVHDLGKSLTLFGEEDGNVDCMNRVVGYGNGGLDGLDVDGGAINVRGIMGGPLMCDHGLNRVRPRRHDSDGDGMTTRGRSGWHTHWG